MATNQEVKEANTILAHIIILGFLFSYLLMLGFGNFDASKGFEDFIPFGLFLAIYKGSSKDA